jgi:hypothetical protein
VLRVRTIDQQRNAKHNFKTTNLSLPKYLAARTEEIGTEIRNDKNNKPFMPYLFLKAMILLRLFEFGFTFSRFVFDENFPINFVLWRFQSENMSFPKK